MRCRPSRSRAATFALIAGLPISSHAAHDGAETLFLESLPVVLSVSRLPSPMLDASGAVTLIDEDTIRDTGYRELDRLFRLVPGMMVGRERGNSQWVTYHGLGPEFPNQMQVLIDGRSVYSPYFFGGPNWGALSIQLEDIERIEVIRGSDSASYGSNAFLGVVNILSRPVANEAGSSVRTRLGNRGIRDLSARAVAREGPLGLRVSAAQRRDRGFPGMHDGAHLRTLDLRTDLRLDTDQELTLFAGVSQGHDQLGYAGTPFNSSGERVARIEDGFVHLRWTYTPAPDQALTVALYRNREQTRERWNVHAPPLGLYDIPVNHDRRSRRDNVEITHRFAPTDSVRVAWGAEWRQDRLNAPVLFHGRGMRNEQLGRMFGNLEWRLSPHWLVNSGVMAERFNGSDTRLSPRLFATWQPDRHQSWRIGYSRAHRQPSLFEQGADVRITMPDTGELLHQRHLANPSIRPQRIDAFELGYLGKSSGGTTLDVRIFSERISDLIWREHVDTFDPHLPGHEFAIRPEPGSIHEHVQRTLGATRWRNLPGKVTLDGVEYQFTFKPWRGGEIRLHHAMLRARAPRHGEVTRSVAPHVAGVHWRQKFGAWHSTATMLRMGRIDAGSGHVPGYRYTVPAYTTLDWSLSRTLHAGAVPVDLRVTGLNLLGRHQELAHRPLQQLAGDRPVNRVRPMVYVDLQARF